MTEVRYNGTFDALRGVYMSRAYESALHISFDVRGGLFVRQLHHWAANVFMAGMATHMMRIFFTGAFRRPRETTWLIGFTLLVLGGFEGFTGYSLPDDLLSGTGIRAAMSGGILSVPIIGTWLHWLLFGGEFPGTEIIPRFFVAHILLIPGLLFGLIATHLGLIWYQKHTQFPGPRRKERNVVGVRIMPVFSLKTGGFFCVIVGVLALLAGLFQINPIWNFGPYSPAQVSAGSQPDWYMAWTDGLLRLWPDWEINLGHRYLIPAVFFPLVAIGLVLTAVASYPLVERKLTRNYTHHNLLQRPRDTPVRTSLGAMGVTFFVVTTISCGNDIIAEKFDISLNAMTWAGRIGVLVLPPLAYYVAYRICLGLQYADRDVLQHGVETGIVVRTPEGAFIEVHQPLGGIAEHGHAIPLPYQAAPVPKKMNKLGAAGRAVPGSLYTPDPPSETVAADSARQEQAIETRERDARNQQRDLPMD
jgi:ubiquinol-cytochrome c reductase cytochrome b subunit